MKKILTNVLFLFVFSAISSCSDSFENDVADNTFNTTAKAVSGNIITNGDFNNGTNNWYLYAGGGSAATMYVDNGVMVVDITDIGDDSATELNLGQGNLTFSHGKSYLVSFKAKTDIPRKIYAKAGMSVEPWVPLYSQYQEFDVTTSFKQCTFAFAMSEDTDSNSHLELQFGYRPIDNTPATKIYIDDVVVKEINNNQVPNYKFNYGMWGWDGFIREGTSGDVRVLRYARRAKVTYYSGDDHPDPWDLELKRTGLSIENGKTYVVSFDSWANFDRSCRAIVALHEEPWTDYSNIGYYNLQTYNSQYNHLHKYSFTFTMNYTTDNNAYLAFQCGGDFDIPAIVYIDNVVVAEVDQLLD